MVVGGADPRAAFELLARPGVVPTRVVPGFDGPEVVLVDLGRHVFREAFFDESVNAALSALRAYPERMRLPIEDLVAFDGYPDAVPLAGLVFHVSRCGSTLVSRTLAQDESTHVVAEADPIDVVVTRMRGDEETRVRRLRGLVRAYARRRTERTERLVLKLDAWHLRSLPLFRAAFPEVPWVVVVRDPLEVLASTDAAGEATWCPVSARPSISRSTPPSSSPTSSIATDAWCCAVCTMPLARASQPGAVG